MGGKACLADPSRSAGGQRGQGVVKGRERGKGGRGGGKGGEDVIRLW